MTRRNTLAGLDTKNAWRLAAFVALLVFGVSPARANQYLFTFTTSQVLAALTATQTSAVVHESAYFALFVQPDPAVITNYSYLSEITPNPSDPNVWAATTITDPANPNLGAGTWAQFSKTASQTAVTVISNASAPGFNIFLGQNFSDANTPPVGWGPTNGTINTIMDSNAQFKFWIDTPMLLSPATTYTIKGKASALVSGSSLSFYNVKEQDGLSFSLSLTAQAPEPGTLGMMLLAAGSLLALRKRELLRKTRRG